jgi:glyceraldehyde-3-phosphate dehydrogenase/erythrose-4-phosphate dehydrogenase
MAINDPFLSSDMLLYLLKYDSVFGRFNHDDLELAKGGIKIKGHFIKTY